MQSVGLGLHWKENLFGPARREGAFDCKSVLPFYATTYLCGVKSKRKLIAPRDKNCNTVVSPHKPSVLGSSDATLTIARTVLASG